jgi:hypothetical protein
VRRLRACADRHVVSSSAATPPRGQTMRDHRSWRLRRRAAGPRVRLSRRTHLAATSTTLNARSRPRSKISRTSRSGCWTAPHVDPERRSGRRLRRGRRGIGQLDEAFGVRPEPPAGVGQAHGPGRADEPRDAEVGPEPADPLGSPCWLRHSLPAARPKWSSCAATTNARTLASSRSICIIGVGRLGERPDETLTAG